MKKILHALIVMLIAILGLVGCKKSTITTPTKAISYWEFNGKKDTASETFYADQGNFLEANRYVSDTVTNILIIGFSTKPVANGKFLVVGSGTTPNSKECIIESAIIVRSLPILGVESVGQAGDSVTVTIVNGKINASFSNIVIQDAGGFYSLISGELIQQ